MTTYLSKLQATIAPLRTQIVNHPLYSEITDLNALRIFMKYHVYAVWDFMSLLKALQNNLTCTSIPWYPKADPDTRFLINEIVCGEESDVDANGNRKSHFELYVEAMEQSGSDFTPIHKFIESLKSTSDFEASFSTADTPEAAQQFVNGTFDVINSGASHIQAAVFTFSREDLIPNMFYSIVNDINKAFPDSVSIFKYYLDRHIEVDGDHHSHLALEMTSNLCGDNPIFWQEAEAATVNSLQLRIKLWDAALSEILLIKEKKAESVQMN